MEDEKRLIPDVKVQRRYGVSAMTIWRWDHDKQLDFPRPSGSLAVSTATKGSSTPSMQGRRRPMPKAFCRCRRAAGFQTRGIKPKQKEQSEMSIMSRVPDNYLKGPDIEAGETVTIKMSRTSG